MERRRPVTGAEDNQQTPGWVLQGGARVGLRSPAEASVAMNGTKKGAGTSQNKKVPRVLGLTAQVDFSLLAISSLRKYKKAHRVRLKPTTSKQELADAVAKHFAQLPPPDDEDRIIEAFSSALKNHGKPSQCPRHYPRVQRGSGSGDRAPRRNDVRAPPFNPVNPFPCRPARAPPSARCK